MNQFDEIKNRQALIAQNITKSFIDNDLEKSETFDIEKAKAVPVGTKNKYGEVKQQDGTWKYERKSAQKPSTSEDPSAELSRGQTVNYNGKSEKIVAIHPNGTVLLESGEKVNKSQIYLSKEKEAKKEGFSHKTGDIIRHGDDSYKKQENGKWLEVSSHGLTKKEHKEKINELQYKNSRMDNSDYSDVKKIMDQNNADAETHSNDARELSDKEHTDEDLGLDNTKKLPEYVEGKFYQIPVTKKDLSALRKRFNINKDGQSGTVSSGFEISSDKSEIQGRGKMWVSILKTLKDSRNLI